MMEIKTAVVTGVSGFIGKNLAKKLLSQGTKVYGVCTKIEKVSDLLENPKFICILTTFEQYSVLLERIHEPVDVWFHFAFQGGFGGENLRNYCLQLDNAKYTCSSVELASTLKVKKFIFASTVNELESLGYLNNGFTAPRFTCIYSAGKIATEIIGKTIAVHSGIDFISGLIAMPYGTPNYANSLPNVVMKQLNSGLIPQLISGNNLYDLIYIDDLVDAFIAMGSEGHNLKSYYVGHRTLKTFRELITAMRDAVAPKSHLNFGAYPDAPELDYSMIDLDALYRDTGFECHADFKESILKTAAWLKEAEDR
ncbi:NAD-dependent epimerase/dehydratase family protein [Oscillibacter sp. GMB15532]|uniref:NAD-dependent epimerase/dehydratase family protein n=1 Tax=Oscillibacter sp. GMB15532 TaxID=3230022 RepID=UPI0034E00D8D